MATVTYKLLDTKKITADKDYFISAGENLTTTIQAVFPLLYSTAAGWSQSVVFKLNTSVTLDGGVVTTAPKFSIPTGAYIIPNILISAGIIYIQFVSEKLMDGLLNRFETEEKIFPRIAPSIIGGLGSVETMPNGYMTVDMFNVTQSFFEDAENVRVGSEDLRLSSEIVRHTTEELRIEAETGRGTAESIRASSENTRIGNENIRLSAESARYVTFVDSESDRESAFMTSESNRNGLFSTNEVDRDATILLFKNWYNGSNLTGRLPFMIDGGDFGDVAVGAIYNGGDF